MLKDAFIKRLKELCVERKISYTELARMAGVSPSTIYSLLQPERRNISVITIKKICDALELSLGEFFNTPEFNSLEQELQ
ncbi:MAG: helix-turn-helix transcriptional regulator [Oscillospiraceae bacterium]|jgi:DNA-binding Xre family transcriptional regulator|nr:helix-turn-helix transcriptional regulator [Oscillospiraceae bacterium]